MWPNKFAENLVAWREETISLDYEPASKMVWTLIMIIAFTNKAMCKFDCSFDCYMWIDDVPLQPEWQAFDAKLYRLDKDLSHQSPYLI